MSDSPEPPLEPWWTPGRLYYLALLIVGSLAGLFCYRRGGGVREYDITWLVRPIYHAIRHLLGT